MPELPEVETVMRGLTPVMRGGVIARADVNRPDLRFPLPPDMAARLTGARIMGLSRRAKYILVDLERPDNAPETLLIHLGMSGRMRIENAQTGAFFHDIAPSEKHDHVVLHLGSRARITYNDARRFGAMDLCATSDVASHPWLRHLGPEPLGNGFNAVDFAAAIRLRKSPIKTVLLDQTLVAGLGNIYVCESLFDAGISPSRPALSLSKDDVSRLIPAIRDTLNAAIEAGGASLKDHRQVDGQLGYFQHGFKAYGRAGEPCNNPTCDGQIERITQAGRSTFHCPKCQR